MQNEDLEGCFCLFVFSPVEQLSRESFFLGNFPSKATFPGLSFLRVIFQLVFLVGHLPGGSFPAGSFHSGAVT